MAKRTYAYCSCCHKPLPEGSTQNYCKECRKLYDSMRLQMRSNLTADAKLEKLCPVCGRILPLTYFYRNARGRYGRATYCKQCYGLMMQNRHKDDKFIARANALTTETDNGWQNNLT